MNKSASAVNGLSVALFFSNSFPLVISLRIPARALFTFTFTFYPVLERKSLRRSRPAVPSLLGSPLASTGELTFSKLPNVAAACTPPPVKGMLGARVTDSCRRRAFSTGDGLKKTYLLSRTALGLR
jgi:hypothetical protein